MTKKKFLIIEKKLLNQFPSFVIDGAFMFIPPVGDFVRGIYFENASGHSSFYIRVLFLPLFVPREIITFVNSSRLTGSGGELWDAENPNLIRQLCDAISAEGIPFLETVSTLDGILRYLKKKIQDDWPMENSHHVEQFAYALIKNGETEAALKVLDNLKESLKGSITPWIIGQRNRVELIEGKLLQSRRLALVQLETWKLESIKKLGLEKYSKKCCNQ